MECVCIQAHQTGNISVMLIDKNSFWCGDIPLGIITKHVRFFCRVF